MRLCDVSENEDQGGKQLIVTYHSFLIVGFVQVTCLSVRGMLDPIDAKAKVRRRAVRPDAFIFAGFKNIQAVELLKDLERASYI